jgi:hypothetical protein
MGQVGAMTPKLILVFFLLSWTACSREAQDSHRQESAQATNSQVAVSEQQAVSVAKEDALKTHLSPDAYDIFAIDEGEMWHVIFEPKDKGKNNVEVEYQIFKVNGRLAGTIYEKGFRRLPSGSKNLDEIDRNRAISVAKEDAIKHGPIEDYDVVAFDEREFWHVVFSLKNKELAGGGPDYLIDKRTGKVVERKVYQ